MDLEAEVKQLKEQVRKLQVLLAKTGEQVMQMQMAARKGAITDLDAKTKEMQQLAGNTDGRPSYVVVESDLNDMVVELQQQLRLLDERGIRRVQNARSKSELIPLPNADGEEHPKFPKTIKDLQKLTDAELFEQWNHFEMLPNGENLEDLLDEDETEAAKLGNMKVMQEIYDAFAKNVGIDPKEYPRI